ncbi:MAG: tetratricopeptide repeat protein, partial [Chitinophagaceae bacterium]|nr:tetratricopeptide repeat protein [Chitinophagaceae bacterium]
GLAYRKLSDASKAFLAYQQALKKDKNNVKAYYLLGKIFTAQKNQEVYLEHFMKAYKIDSTYAPVLEALYDHYYNIDVRIARKYLEKFIANTDHTIQHDYRMTDMYYLTGDYDRAITGALKLIDTEKEKAQPRLYKLMAYSAMKSKDTLKALEYANQYFSKEQPVKLIAADFELKAILTEAQPGAEKGAIDYYSIAAEMDTLVANKIKYATAIIKLTKKADMISKQAYWLGKLYQWKEKTNNIDLFNWGLAHYTAAEYLQSDSVFTLYTERYPEDIFGHYWRAQANAAIDTALAQGLAVPHYIKVTEIGEKDKEKNKKMLLKAYGYLGGYEANIRKDYVQSLMWFEKFLELDDENADAKRYAETLRKWVDEQKK